MSLRNTWNRMLRRASSSSITSTSSTSDTAITPASTAPSSPGWGPSATFSWLVPSAKSSSSSPSSTSATATVAAQPALPHNNGDKKKKSKKSTSSTGQKKRLHPSERPLTKENLRHQEMFANFSFGEPGSSSRGCSTRHSFESGISPCGSRRASFVDA